MNNLTWTDEKAFIPSGSDPNWKWEESSKSIFKVSGGDAFWRITPTHTEMGATSQQIATFTPERTMWFVEFGSEHNRWTPMEARFTYDQEWEESYYAQRWVVCLKTNRILFYTLNEAKKFCETTFGFSTMVDTRAVV